MDYNQKDIQKQFQGFLHTPFLWEGDSVFNMQQIELPLTTNTTFNEILPNNLRLGKRVERFVSTELSGYESVSICSENIQVQKGKTTLGEIDCILKRDDTPIHLEIVYKFYLFDPTVGDGELECWIGPNRKDSLIKKLCKLKEKQLPLLYNPYTKPILENLNISVEDVEQRIYFKAQLFLPYNSNNVQFSLLNPDCIKGFYIHFSVINQFQNGKFYIPSKHNWLQEPTPQVNWMKYNIFNEKIKVLMAKEIAPLCWIKLPNGEITKCFVVWWK